MNRHLGICIVGAGKIALANHLPGIALSGRAKVVALCDSDATALASAAKDTGVTRTGVRSPSACSANQRARKWLAPLSSIAGSGNI